MSDHDDAQYVLIERRGGSSFGAFVWGAALGAGIAMLVAPRSGTQIRNELRTGVQRLRDRAEDVVSTAREGVTGRIDGVRSDVRGRVDAARDAFEAGRCAARDTHNERAQPASRTAAASDTGLETEEDTGV